MRFICFNKPLLSCFFLLVLVCKDDYWILVWLVLKCPSDYSEVDSYRLFDILEALSIAYFLFLALELAYLISIIFCRLFSGMLLRTRSRSLDSWHVLTFAFAFVWRRRSIISFFTSWVKLITCTACVDLISSMTGGRLCRLITHSISTLDAAVVFVHLLCV